ncbi:MAG TPA: PQQ-dependent sugar dehydrogenase [Candidatus Nitrosopolaris sp.]|nr:PQQ-dependent sugar dehydrogenase [Candidatus Nitrosopolaris sp.]
MSYTLMHSKRFPPFFLVFVLVNIIPIGCAINSAYGQASFAGPIINDSNLKAELVFKGLKSPTSMIFLGPNDILVLEKDQGTVKRIINGNMLPQPLLQVNVLTDGERGMLGIAVAKNVTNGTRFVFLYYTESKQIVGTFLGNRVYRYELVDNKLLNPKLILNLPATPGPFHNGGKVLIGPDNNVYAVVGDLLYHRTQAQNVASGGPPDLTSGIIRATEDGKPVPNSPLGDTYPLNLYYAYGIRNSFGMDFDPVTGKLWDTENGPNFGDEINLVEPGFNSGWVQVQGIWSPNGPIEGENPGANNLHPPNLVDFEGKGKYRAPEFVWFQTVAPTALKFLNSTKLGKQYQNDMFVGDYNNGNLYHFKLNKNRTALVLGATLDSKIARTAQDANPVILGSGFGAITDLQVGLDGYLYVLTFGGAIYRIVPVTSG